MAVLRRRFLDEGVCFLTKTLPALGKAIDYALANGTCLQAPSFARRKGSKLPRFLGWLIGMVFSSDGFELRSSDPYALSRLRHLLFLLSKLELPYATSEESKVIDSFKVVDSEVGTLGVIDDVGHHQVVRFASSLVRRVLQSSDPRNIVPRHGPGMTANGSKPWDKPFFETMYSRADEVYPFTEYFHLNLNHTAERIGPQGVHAIDSNGGYRPLIVRSTSTAKVVLVPKDSRGPRLISMEPLETQWLQQGQMELLVSSIESSWLTRGHVNFSNQEVNRQLALYASASAHATASGESPPSIDDFFGVLPKSLARHARPDHHDLVTLDMKDASDRVSLAHVANLFPENWVEALYATRSDSTVLPDGSVLPLHKFAPMGSAVCFPVEALVFWALSVSAIHLHRPELSLSRLRKRVWVFGDDLVIHKEDYLVVIAALERYGLRFNRNKCCIAGSFRESCGIDAYKGIVVTPVRIKAQMSHRLTANGALSYIAYSNALYERCYFKLASVLERRLLDMYPIAYTSDRGSQGQFVRPYSKVLELNKASKVRVRFNTKLQRLEAYAFKTSAVIKDASVDSYEGMLYCMSRAGALRPTPEQPIAPTLIGQGGTVLEAG
ncbi:TPA_asm: RNA-directed RNA polymerase, partial [ssRNA phage SRR7976301_11]